MTKRWQNWGANKRPITVLHLLEMMFSLELDVLRELDVLIGSAWKRVESRKFLV